MNQFQFRAAIALSILAAIATTASHASAQSPAVPTTTPVEATPQTAPTSDDRFIAGYAAAVLNQEFHLQSSTVIVNHGVIRVASADLGAADRARIMSALSQIPGVVSVEVVEAPSTTTTLPANLPQSNPTAPGVETTAEPQPWKLFSSTNVFQPLIADPRWPNFSAAYDRYIGGEQHLGDYASVSFGESLSIYDTSSPKAGEFELGIQAAVFAIFDMNSESFDLVNADYFVGPVAEYRQGDFSGLLRVYHQSSHLGDEYLLDHPGIQRINLSYEEVDAIASYELFDRKLRIYGGGGYLFDRDPSTLKPGALQYGVEYRGERIFPSLGMIPIAGVDLQNRQENNWDVDISVRGGVQFQDSATLGRTVQILLEYYAGHSPNGQFSADEVQFIGLGLHFYL